MVSSGFARHLVVAHSAYISLTYGVLGGGVMRIIETMGYIVWYGTFILFGITFGLMLHPLIADAYEIVDTSFETGYSLGNLAPQNGWATGTSPSIQVVNETYGVSPQHGAIMLQVGDVHRYVNYPVATSTYVGEDQQILSYYWYAYDYTTGTNAPAINTSWRFYNSANVLQQTLYTCAYPTSGTVATFRISSGSNCNSGTITSVKTSMPQGYWASVVCIYDKSANTFGCSIDGETQVNYSVALDVDNTYVQPTTVQGYTYGEGFLDNYGWYSDTGSGGGTSSSTTNYITDVYPADQTYSVATTSYVNMTVQIPASRYAQNSWKAKVACAEILDNTWFQSLTDYGFSYTVDLDDGDCANGASCTPHGVSYPPDGEIEADAVYNCTAVLYEAKWYWFDTQIEKEFFRFYTFSATSTSDFADLIARADELQGSVNLTGTSTNPVFGDCSILTGQIADCVIEPIKYLLIPSGTDKDNIKELIDTTVFDKFPFSYVGLFNQDMASSSFYATTTADFPDFAFSTQNMNGVTTTVTIFDGSEFVSSWSTVSEFDTLRTAIQYALIIMFTTILYFRVRRLIPSSDNVQGI